MADGRRRDEWARTARVCSVLANIHRDKSRRARPFADEEFNPYADADKPKPKPGARKASIHILKSVFVPKNGKTQKCPPQRSVPARLTSN